MQLFLPLVSVVHQGYLPFFFAFSKRRLLPCGKRFPQYFLSICEDVLFILVIDLCWGLVVLGVFVFWGKLFPSQSAVPVFGFPSMRCSMWAFILSVPLIFLRRYETVRTKFTHILLSSIYYSLGPQTTTLTNRSRIFVIFELIFRDML